MEISRPALVSHRRGHAKLGYRNDPHGRLTRRVQALTPQKSPSGNLPYVLVINLAVVGLSEPGRC